MASRDRPACWSCHACGDCILDKASVVKVEGNTWHGNCLKCNDCKVPLKEKCYSRNNILYCRKDYFGKFAPKCCACDKNLLWDDVVRRVEDFVFHESCLRCAACSKKFDTGDCLYGTDDMKIVCRKDHAKIAKDATAKNNMADSKAKVTTETAFYGEGGKQSDPASLELDDGVSCRLDSEDVVNSRATTGKKRGPRTTIKTEQQNVLAIAFKNAPKPTRVLREQLSKETGLSMRVIQVWFQNRRSKERRMNQASPYNARRHMYSRLPQRQMQNSFMVRPNDRQAPNMIMDSGTGPMGMYSYIGSATSTLPSEQVLRPSNSYCDAIDPHHLKLPHSSPDYLLDAFPESGHNNSCQGVGDFAPFSPSYSDGHPSEYSSEKSFMDNLASFHVGGAQALEYYPGPNMPTP